jgi:hypothetical protein
MIIFCKNEEGWRGRISDMGTLRNGKTFYFVEDAVSDSGKTHSFDVEGKEYPLKWVFNWLNNTVISSS